MTAHVFLLCHATLVLCKLVELSLFLNLQLRKLHNSRDKTTLFSFNVQLQHKMRLHVLAERVLFNEL